MLDNLIVFVEELSMEAVLERLLPSLLGECAFQIIRFQCKDDLLKKAPDRLRGYATWLPKTWRILVLVDQDGDDCHVLKAQLENMAAGAAMLTKTAAQQNQRFQVVNRIVIEELEAWFFGDWSSVQAAYPRVPASLPEKAAFRDPDAIAGGTWEALERVLKRAGYFSTGLRKLEFARKVAQHMTPDLNRSRSFHAFVGAVAASLT